MRRRHRRDNRKQNIIIIIILLLTFLAIIKVIGDRLVSDHGDIKSAIDSSKQINLTEEEFKQNIIEDREYKNIKAEKLLEELNRNSSKASEMYLNGFYEIEGIIKEIDPSGISVILESENNKNKNLDIKCYTKSDDQREVVSVLKVGESLKIKGQIVSIEDNDYIVDTHQIIPQ